MVAFTEAVILVRVQVAESVAAQEGTNNGVFILADGLFILGLATRLLIDLASEDVPASVYFVECVRSKMEDLFGTPMSPAPLKGHRSIVGPPGMRACVRPAQRAFSKPVRRGGMRACIETPVSNPLTGNNERRRGVVAFQNAHTQPHRLTDSRCPSRYPV